MPSGLSTSGNIESARLSLDGLATQLMQLPIWLVWKSGIRKGYRVLKLIVERWMYSPTGKLHLAGGNGRVERPFT